MLTKNSFIKDPVEPKDQIGENDTFSVKLVNHKKRKIAFPPGSAKAQIQENTVDKKKYVNLERDSTGFYLFIYPVFIDFTYSFLSFYSAVSLLSANSR